MPQPWAAAITYADMRVESRPWSTLYRGPVLIHAGETVDQRHGPMVAAVVRGLQLDLDAVLAVARVTDCHEDDGECTPWSKPGKHHLVLDEVTALALPIPWGGAPRLWTPPTVLMDRVREQLSDETAAHVLREGA
jgi:hypothetical protein